VVYLKVDDESAFVESYLDVLREQHPHYPDCCIAHVNKAILEEHAAAHVPDMLEAAQ
jgi:hypothetical protein